MPQDVFELLNRQSWNRYQETLFSVDEAKIEALSDVDVMSKSLVAGPHKLPELTSGPKDMPSSFSSRPYNKLSLLKD